MKLSVIKCARTDNKAISDQIVFSYVIIFFPELLNLSQDFVQFNSEKKISNKLEILNFKSHYHFDYC
jgi:hypothetical protein